MIAVDGHSYQVIEGQVYSESKYTKAFPNLFKEVTQEEIILQESLEDTLAKPLEKIEEVSEKIDIIVNSKFSWYRFILIGFSIMVIVGISAYLRIHGIMSVFNIDVYMASILVSGLIVSEFTISSLMLREITSKLHHFMNVLILGGIQLILIVIAFTFEFSTMSNYIEKQKVAFNVGVNNVSRLNDGMQDYDKQISVLEAQLKITPEDAITKRAKLSNRLNNLLERKNKERERLGLTVNDKELVELQKKGVGFENTAKIIGVSEAQITRYIIIFVAGILNILYIMFMYGFISEWKRRGKS
jgi:hypothetical protein